MAPEIIMLIIIIMLVRTSIRTEKNEWKAVNFIAALFVVLLAWGGFFNDIGALFVAGFTRIFN